MGNKKNKTYSSSKKRLDIEIPDLHKGVVMRLVKTQVWIMNVMLSNVNAKRKFGRGQPSLRPLVLLKYLCYG